MNTEGVELDVDAILAGSDDVPEGHRSGIVAIAGRPNVGKSTLVNQLVGTKVAIVTRVPGTTRNAIRGIVTRPDSQLVLLDTPGLAKPRTLLARRLNDLVRGSWAGVDIICFVVDVAAGVGPGDTFMARELVSTQTPIVVAANKVDRIQRKDDMLPALEQLADLVPGAEILPVSARTGDGVGELADVLVEHAPEGPPLFPGDIATDQPMEQLLAEILREKLIVQMREEVPHSIAVEIESIDATERDDLLDVHAVIHVERQSQKGIVIGKGGATLKKAGTRARPEMEALLGLHVHLETRVKVAPRWQQDPRRLKRFGY
ncbi:MAG: GTPase Era [Nitriliruptorales bacterium]|nr:GTPase Era [Nitriliruptorales bacterium]